MSILQIRAQSVRRIDEALTRLAADQYGTCAVCGLAISERRLRALPFAVRCTRCEDRREENGEGFREFAKKGAGFALVAASAGPEAALQNAARRLEDRMTMKGWRVLLERRHCARASEFHPRMTAVIGV